MITEKDIQTRTAEILMNAGFNVVASEVDEGFLKPAVFVSAYPSDVQPQCCGGALEELTVSVELKYISALETVLTAGLKSFFCTRLSILWTDI